MDEHPDYWEVPKPPRPPHAPERQFAPASPPPKKRGNWARYLIVTGAATVLATLGINAADNMDDLSASLVGKLFIGGMEDVARCEIGMVFVGSAEGGFCIDAYENSAGNGCSHAVPGNQIETRENIERDGCKPVSEAGRVPWTNISQNQAAIACARSGKRLPGNREWYQGALGTPDAFGSSPEECLLGERSVGAAAPTGERSACVSPAGAYDMVGNAWEWVEDTITEGVYRGRRLPGEGYVRAVDESGMPIETDLGAPDPNYYSDYFWVDHAGVRGMFRGGFWGIGADAGQYAVHAISPPSFAGAAVGFRCVKDPTGKGA